MQKVELLSPAGNFERLKIALLYGADAVYFGGRNYSLRANAKNFSLTEIKEACVYAHNLGKKVYVTVNIVFHDEDIVGLVDYLKELEKCRVDAIIVSDLAVIKLIKEHNINLPIHISTQYSTLNKEAVKFFKGLGVERVVLGREASKEEIKEIIDETGVEIETFIHGAMCASYSGRCVLSNYFTNRDANRGGCSQICRWTFDMYENDSLVESPVQFTMSSKDLRMLECLKDMIEIGVSSLKVERRMRSIYYIATVISTYRKAIDECYAGTLTDELIAYYKKVLNRVANRDSCPQFFNEFPGVDEQYFLGREEVSNQDYLAIVDDYDGEYVYLTEKNYFRPGDVVEFISPNKETFSYVVPQIYDLDGNELECARHPEEKIKFKLNKTVSQYDMMRIRLN